ncbi:MAG: hypothetical protein ACQES9_08050 [Myxococcota bacterium]
MDSLIQTFIYSLVVTFIILLLLREVTCWYLKINNRIRNDKLIINQLKVLNKNVYTLTSKFLQNQSSPALPPPPELQPLPEKPATKELTTEEPTEEKEEEEEIDLKERYIFKDNDYLPIQNTELDVGKCSYCNQLSPESELLFNADNQEHIHVNCLNEIKEKMNKYKIKFENGKFYYITYKYNKFKDALNYAQNNEE